MTIRIENSWKNNDGFIVDILGFAKIDYQLIFIILNFVFIIEY